MMFRSKENLMKRGARLAAVLFVSGLVVSPTALQGCFGGYTANYVQVKHSPQPVPDAARATTMLLQATTYRTCETTVKIDLDMILTTTRCPSHKNVRTQSLRLKHVTSIEIFHDRNASPEFFQYRLTAGPWFWHTMNVEDARQLANALHTLAREAQAR